MKVIIALLLACQVLAGEVQTRSYKLVGYKRNLTLYTLGANMTGMAVYIAGRIEAQGGKRENYPVVIFEDIFKKEEERYKMTIGYPTRGLSFATGSIKTFRIKSKDALEFDYSGPKKQLFKEVFTFINNYPTSNEKQLTGEVRITIDPYNTTLYDITCKVEYIVE